MPGVNEAGLTGENGNVPLAVRRTYHRYLNRILCVRAYGEAGGLANRLHHVWALCLQLGLRIDGSQIVRGILRSLGALATVCVCACARVCGCGNAQPRLFVRDRAGVCKPLFTSLTLPLPLSLPLSLPLPPV